MLRKTLSISALACFLALAACGGGSGSPAPSPVPTPTPTPSPTATPTPSAYPTAFDFTADRTFTGLVTAGTGETAPTLQVTYGGFDNGTIRFTYGTLGLAFFGQEIVPNTAGTTISQSESSIAYNYTFATFGADVTIYKAPAPLNFVAYLYNEERVKPVTVRRFALLGAPTRAADLPLGGATTYALQSTQFATLSTGQTLALNGPGRSVSGTIQLTLPGRASAARVALQGSLDPATGRVDGTAATSDNALSGAFHGRLYGPAGVEIGLLLNLADSSGTDTPGVIVGRAQ